jgi:predicted enzyme related to lactoylglutathione lyase
MQAGSRAAQGRMHGPRALRGLGTVMRAGQGDGRAATTAGALTALSSHALAYNEGDGSMADNTVRGRFVWHELLTPNKAGAHEFYSKAVGWAKQAWEQDPSYSMFAAASGPLGASIESREDTPHWRPYIGSLDVDETVATATRLGAKVLTPATSLPNAGLFAVLADPQGGKFGVHSSPTEPRPETPAVYGEFYWHELATTTDPVAAFAFYKELFGWDEVRQYDMGPMGMYLVFSRNGHEIGGMFDQSKRGVHSAAHWLGYVRVPNMDAAVATVKAERGAVLNGPMEVPSGDWVAQFRDPHGAFFAVLVNAADTKAAAKSKPEAAKKTAKKTAKKSSKKKVARKAAKKKSRKKTAKRGAKKVGKKAAKKKRAKVGKSPRRKTKRR